MEFQEYPKGGIESRVLTFFNRGRERRASARSHRCYVSFREKFEINFLGSDSQVS